MQKHSFRKGDESGHVFLLNTNRKSYTGHPFVSLDLILSDFSKRWRPAKLWAGEGLHVGGGTAENQTELQGRTTRILDRQHRERPATTYHRKGRGQQSLEAL